MARDSACAAGAQCQMGTPVEISSSSNSTSISRHKLCPCCEKPMHAMCGVHHPIASSIVYGTTCFLCVAKYGQAFKSLEDFCAFQKNKPPDRKRRHHDEDEEPDDAPDDDKTTPTPDDRLKTKTTLITTIKQDDRKRKRVGELMPRLSLDLCDVVPLGEPLYKLKKAKEGQSQTFLRSIGGVSIDEISSDDLKHFCSSHKIYGYKKGSSKARMGDLIAMHFNTMHVQDSLGNKGIDTIGRMESIRKEKKPDSNNAEKHTRYSIPSSVTKAGTYYRAINCLFHESARAQVKMLRAPVNKNKFDEGVSNHHCVFEHLLQIYSNTDNDGDIATLKRTGDGLPFKGVDPSNFDDLDAHELKELLDFIARGYRQVLKLLSRDHRSFANLCCKQMYLHYYNLMLQEDNDMKKIVDQSFGNAFEEEESNGNRNDADEKSNQKSQKEDKRQKRAELKARWSLELCDVVPLGEPLYKIKNANGGQSQTYLRSIAGVSIDDITLDDLKQFCSSQKIPIYNGASKARIGDLIAMQLNKLHGHTHGDVKRIVETSDGNTLGETTSSDDDDDDMSNPMLSTKSCSRRSSYSDRKDTTIENLVNTINENLDVRLKLQQQRLVIVKEATKEKAKQRARMLEIAEQRHTQDTIRSLENDIKRSLTDYMTYKQQLNDMEGQEDSEGYKMVNEMVEYFQQKWNDSVEELKAARANRKEIKRTLDSSHDNPHESNIDDTPRIK